MAPSMQPRADSKATFDKWSQALNISFTQRYRPNEVDEALEELYGQTPITGQQLMSILLNHRYGCEDPLIPMFLHYLLSTPWLKPADVLVALLAVSPYRPRSDLPSQPKPRIATSHDQETILTILITGFTSGQLITDHVDTAKTFRALLRWVQAYNAYETFLQIDSAGALNAGPELIAAFEQLGLFLVVLLNNDTARKHLQKVLSKNVRANINTLLSQFISTLNQWSQTQLAQKLALTLKIPPLFDGGNGRHINFDTTDIAAEVADLPRVVSRAGLYTYLNATMASRPLIDDSHLLSYLQARYQNDHQTMVGDLVVAAFDNLANALHQHESEHIILCHRSFITSKLCVLISALSLTHLYQPAILEQFIQMAMARIETHPFPPISSDTSGINETIRDTRLEFVASCHLHHLISDATAAAALGQAVPTPPGIGHNKQALISQILPNAHKAEALIGELDRMVGNAAAISNALVEVLRHFATSKETSSLKTLCSALCRKLPFVDIMLQHNRLSEIISPLAQYLNEYSQDEDLSELQPVYDDFAAILLFTLAVLHRYDVASAELDMDQDSFLGKLSVGSAQSRPVKDLEQAETQYLSQWIRGLFAVDDKGESIGISDETMAGCSPQAFYLLVPTLFEQIVLAVKAKVLTVNTIKGGLECEYNAYGPCNDHL